MFKVAETNISFKFPGEELKDADEVTTDALWTHLNNNFGQTLPFIEQTIDRWNTQTQILGNLKKSDKSHFSQSIVIQVNSLLAQREQQKRIVDKT